MILPRTLVLSKLPQSLILNTTRRNLAPTSKKPRPQGKHYRLWSMPGDHVLQKDVLAKQYTMKWHPGLNVGIDNDRTIYALREGVMVVTEEKFDPDWDHHLVQEAYISREEKRAPVYKRYIHVLPKKPPQEFKLVDVV